MSPLEIPVSAIDDPLRVSGKYFCEGGEVTFLKIVTFGPFPVGTFRDGGRAELERIRKELGANTIRIYEIPTLDFMHDCAEIGLRVFITIPWSQHIDFFKNSHVLAEVDQLLLETIRQFRGHPALAGYFVGNEIETTLVRWMGRKRVLEQLERLIDLGHANDPNALFAYANYPSTEYLLPRNQDFTAFNLYLETPESLAGYLERLQNLAGDKPLLISEFGVDSGAHGEEEQGKMLEWHIEEVCRAGGAGTTIFAWSDLWQRGGATIADWSFGLTRRDATPKPALDVVRECWKPVGRPGELVALAATPKVSVIVCTYKGSATLVPCLDSLVALDYPNLELILVNDGGDARVNEIASLYPGVNLHSVEHGGLSVARNIGAGAATGDIFVYTDDDCIVERDWLTWIVKGFEKGPDVGCVGGPNIPPPPQSATQARIIAAPGGPAHVLLTDTEAEHLPGCNIAVRREVFEEIGGFNPVFRTAGDDVDFCWRIADAGYELGFVAAAYVWHYRRFTPRAYFRQQTGYGRAEALLMPFHQQRFRGLGGAVWKGQVYISRNPSSSIVYHGHYGYEPFQLVYPSPESGMGDVVLHIVWWVLLLTVTIAGWWSGWLWIPAAAMLFGTLKVALRRASRSRLEPRFDSRISRLKLAGLILLQGLLRSSSRIRHGWKSAKWTQSIGFLGILAARKAVSPWWKLGDEKNFWSENGVGRDELLSAIREEFPASEDDSTGKTDIILKRGLFWNWAVLTTTEYHENEGRLTRLRLLARPQMLTRLLVLPAMVGSLLALLKEPTVFGGGLAIAVVIGYFASKSFMKLKRADFIRAADRIGLSLA
ncbi:glycosyltransferase [Verrucomicrobiales bacterium BCK34]|nr:glycosyltransferase [Verrucomicrobiales bacterium BCK34]